MNIFFTLVAMQPDLTNKKSKAQRSKERKQQNQSDALQRADQLRRQAEAAVDELRKKAEAETLRLHQIEELRRQATAEIEVLRLQLTEERREKADALQAPQATERRGVPENKSDIVITQSQNDLTGKCTVVPTESGSATVGGGATPTSPMTQLIQQLLQKVTDKGDQPNNRGNAKTDIAARRRLEFAEATMAQQVLTQMPKFNGTAEENVKEWTEQIEAILGPAPFNEVQKRALLIGRLGEGPLSVVNAQGATYETAIEALKGAYKITTDPARILAEFRALRRLSGERPAAFVNRISAQAAFSNRLAQVEVVNRFQVMEQLKGALSDEQRILFQHMRMTTPSELTTWLENDEAVRIQPSNNRLPKPIKVSDLAMPATDTAETENDELMTDDPELAMILEEYKKKKSANAVVPPNGKADVSTVKLDALEKRLIESQKDQMEQRNQQRKDLCLLAEQLAQHHADMKANTKCFNCNKDGHFQADCTEPCRYCNGDHASAACTRKKRQRPAPRDDHRGRRQHDRDDRRQGDRPTRDCKFADRCRDKTNCRFNHPERSNDRRRERATNDKKSTAPNDGICHQYNTKAGCPRRDTCTYKHVVRKVDRAPHFDEPAKE